MAGGQERILRNRIRSVQATKKITRAMELIAASRIVKAQQRVQAAVPYSQQITQVVRNLAAVGRQLGQPAAGRAASRSSTVAYVIITADRGLCGGYNSGVLRAAEGEIKEAALAGKDHLTVAGRSQGRELPALPRATSSDQDVRRLLRQPGLRATPARSPST